jgi:AcrR family transcriptional regulator
MSLNSDIHDPHLSMVNLVPVRFVIVSANAGSTTTSLAEQKRATTISWILRATQHAMRDHGLGVTIDDVARQADLNRRTIFRHFATRETLLAAAISDVIRYYSDQLPVFSGGDWHVWLHDLLITAHRMNDSYGGGFWELATSSNLAPELDAMERTRQTARRAIIDSHAHTAWKASGRQGEAPTAVIDAFRIYLSPFFTGAVTRDAGRDWPTAVRLAETAILAALD